MAAILSRVINTATPLSKVLHETFPWCAEEQAELKATFEAYTARKRSTLVLDYDDLLLCWSALVRSPAAAPARAVRSRADRRVPGHQRAQAEIVAAMAGGGATITAVGDDAQAIYGFRNATPRNILDFPERFGADIVVLDRNHRSTPAILATTNAVIAEAAHRHEKVLWSTRGDGPQPAMVVCSDEGAQSAAVCARVLEQHERGVPLRNQAVLFRAAHHSDLLELELGARRIPYVKYGGLRFLEAAHVKDLVCALRLVINPCDELAWFRVLQLIDGIGPATARKLAPLGGAIDAPGTADLLAALRDARRLANQQGPSPAIERLRAWLEPIIERHHANAAARIADLDALGVAAASAPPRTVPHGAGARPTVVHRRARRPAAPRRRLAHAVDDSLGQGRRVGRRPRHPSRRRQLAVRHGHRERRGDRRGTPAAVRGHDAPATASGATCRCATTSAWGERGGAIVTATRNAAASSPMPSWPRWIARATPS